MNHHQLSSHDQKYIFKKVYGTSTHCGVGYMSIRWVSRGHVIRVLAYTTSVNFF